MNNMNNLNRLNTETSNLNVEDVEDGSGNSILHIGYCTQIDIAQSINTPD